MRLPVQLVPNPPTPPLFKWKRADCGRTDKNKVQHVFRDGLNSRGAGADPMATYVQFQSVLSVNEECSCSSCSDNKCAGPKAHQYDQRRAASLLLAGREATAPAGNRTHQMGWKLSFILSSPSPSSGRTERVSQRRDISVSNNFIKSMDL